MLTKTYIHIPGISVKTERHIHSFGVCDWLKFLNSPPPLNQRTLNTIRRHIPESLSQLKRKNVDYFASLLPSREHWRLVEPFSDLVAAVDIETTGGSTYSTKITVIGISANGRYYAFYDDFDERAVARLLSRFRILLTYNGKRFDIPCLIRCFNWRFLKRALNVDLMYLCRRFGLKGGLKAVEKSLRIERPCGIEDLNGYDAVLLYKRYREGDNNSLRLLLEYNRSDTENLLTIFELIYPLLCEDAMYGIQDRTRFKEV